MYVVVSTVEIKSPTVVSLPVVVIMVGVMVVIDWVVADVDVVVL